MLWNTNKDYNHTRYLGIGAFHSMALTFFFVWGGGEVKHYDYP